MVKRSRLSPDGLKSGPLVLMHRFAAAVLDLLLRCGTAAAGLVFAQTRDVDFPPGCTYTNCNLSIAPSSSWVVPEVVDACIAIARQPSASTRMPSFQPSPS